MPSNDKAAILINQRLDSFAQFAELAVAWNADFRQLTSEQIKPEMFQAQVGTILLSSARFGCHVEQRGESPEGMCSFAVPWTDSPEMLWYGDSIGSNVLLRFPNHRELDIHSKPGFHAMTFSIPEAVLVNHFDRGGHPGLRKVLQSEKTVFPTSGALLNQLRQALRLASRLAGQEVLSQFMMDEIQEQIISILIGIFRLHLPESGSEWNGSQEKLGSMLEFIRGHDQEPLQVVDLCNYMKVSERGLQVLFKSKLGMTPKAYLTGRRMYGAHRALWCSDPSSSGVSDVMNEWGYWHMGNFAAYYRKMFGELPSETLKKSSQYIPEIRT